MSQDTETSQPSATRDASPPTPLPFGLLIGSLREIGDGVESVAASLKKSQADPATVQSCSLALIAVVDHINNLYKELCKHRELLNALRHEANLAAKQAQSVLEDACFAAR